MDELLLAMVATLLAALVFGVGTFLTLRIGIENRLTRLESEVEALRPLRTFMSEFGQRLSGKPSGRGCNHEIVAR